MSSHIVEKVYKDEKRPTYGNMLEKYKQPWVRCSCGWEVPNNALLGNRDAEFERLRLTHIVTELAALMDIEI